MFALTTQNRNNPYTNSYRSYSDIDRIFDSFFDNSRSANRGAAYSVPKNRYAITESEEGYLINFAVPGIKPENINLSFEKGVLEVSANAEESVEKDSEKEVEAKKVFSQRFNVPDNVNVENISAVTELGELKINLPKKEVEKARQIEVKAS